MSKGDRSHEKLQKSRTHWRKTSRENLDPIKEVCQETIQQDHLYLGDSIQQQSQEQKQRESSQKLRKANIT
jgi:hypothetical protein